MNNHPNNQHQATMNMRGRTEDETLVWLDVISAVQYLSRTHRPGFTVSDALAEAIQESQSRQPNPKWEDLEQERAAEQQSETLRTAPQSLMAISNSGGPGVPGAAVVLTTALRAWTIRMSIEFNASMGWPHPVSHVDWILIHFERDNGD